LQGRISPRSSRVPDSERVFRIPIPTLRVYAHAMLEEEIDLSFAEFGSPRRPYTAPINEDEISEPGNYLESMARREGLEPPTLRFEESGRNEYFFLKTNGYEFCGDGENGDTRQ